MPQKQITVALDIGGVCVVLHPERYCQALGIPQGTEIPKKRHGCLLRSRMRPDLHTGVARRFPRGTPFPTDRK